MASDWAVGEALKIRGRRTRGCGSLANYLVAGAVVALFLTLIASPSPAWGDCPSLSMTTECWMAGDLDRLKRRAANGDVEANATLGDCYSATPSLLSRHFAAKWYRRAAELGNVRAQQVIGEMYEFGDGVWANRATALMWIRKAQAQNPHSAALIGAQYIDWPEATPHGFRCKGRQNVLKAIDWYRLSAEAGDSLAQTVLGELLVNRGIYPAKGDAVESYYQEAARWLLSAADVSGQAALELGFLYAKGRGVPQSNEQSVRWYRRATELGVGYDTLAGIYDQGILVPRDPTRAMELYHEAAPHSLPYTEGILLDLFQRQFGIPSFPTVRQKLDWYRAAANSGDLAAQAGLGLQYEYGNGVPRNWLVAYALYTLVARSSSPAKDQVPDFRYFAEPQKVDAIRSSVGADVWKLVDEMKKPGNLLNAIDEFVKLHPTRNNPEDHPDIFFE
jgi:TPR repeat protein